MKKYSYIELLEDNIRAFRAVCPDNNYGIYAPARIERDLFRIVPSGLWVKSDSLFIMSSGNAVGTSYCMINCNRYDPKANAIDQEPIFFAYVGNEPICKGIIIHHGNWNGRTCPVPDGFQDYLLASGLGNYYPLADLPSSTAGPITDVRSTSIHEAFDKGVKKIITATYI